MAHAGNKPPSGGVLVVFCDGEENPSVLSQETQKLVQDNKIVQYTISYGNNASTELEKFTYKVDGEVYYVPHGDTSRLINVLTTISEKGRNSLISHISQVLV